MSKYAFTASIARLKYALEISLLMYHIMLYCLENPSSSIISFTTPFSVNRLIYSTGSAIYCGGTRVVSVASLLDMITFVPFTSNTLWHVSPNTMSPCSGIYFCLSSGSIPSEKSIKNSDFVSGASN